MKALSAVILAVALPVSAFAASVDPALLALAAPGAKALFGIKTEQVQSSPFGQYLMSQVQLDANTKKLMASIGFDYRRDLREILAISGDTLGDALLAGRGSFHPDKIAGAAQANSLASSSYRGCVLVEGKIGDGKPGGVNQAGAIAFLDSSTVVAGDLSVVKAAIDRHAAGTVLSGALAERARLISSANDAWMATLSPPAAAFGATTSSQLGPLGNVLQSALQISAGLKFASSEVTMSADVLTRSAQDAQSIADLLKFAAGMVKGNAPGAPDAARNAIAGVQISTSGPVLRLMLSVPEQQLEQMFIQTPGQPKKVAAVN